MCSLGEEFDDYTDYEYLDSEEDNEYYDVEYLDARESDQTSILNESVGLPFGEEEYVEDDNEPESLPQVQHPSRIEEDETVGNRIVRCQFKNMIFKEERKIGLHSCFIFSCDSCGVMKRIQSCPSNGIGINEAAVLGINSIGLGLYHIEELCAHLDMPTMSNTLYDKISKDHYEAWWLLAKKSASEALNKEIEISIRNGDIDSKGNALITIICDGSWAKRSHGHSFSSLSGFAVIIGCRTNKIIYFDVRNKYCHICKLAQVKNISVREHECNQNYTGPSTGMESDIIVEGFKDCERRGARFNKFIADGDSNTYKVLRDIRPYQNPDLIIQKYECVNHLSKNFKKKFNHLKTLTRYSPDHRKLLTTTLCDNICKGISMAIKHWNDQEISLTEKMHKLEIDIMNAPLHYLGCHENCSKYFCKKITEPYALDLLNSLKVDSLYYALLDLCQTYFADNTKSLLAGLTTNTAESFNNNVAKVVAGKRVNYCLGTSYALRVAAAVVQRNSGGHGGSEFQKCKYNVKSDRVIRLETIRKRKSDTNIVRKQGKPKIRRLENENETRRAYGEGCEEPDKEPAAFSRAEEQFLGKLRDFQEKRVSIQESTIHKKQSEYWLQIRQDLLNCSYFGRVINTKNRRTFTTLLDEILYQRTEFVNTAQNRHSRVQEREALSVFRNLYDLPLKECGIFIDAELCFLGATPFMLCGDEHILSIKCPVKQFKDNIDEAIHNKKIGFWKVSAGNVTINKNSTWYIEIQGQLHITRRKSAYLMIWLGDLPTQYKVVKVSLDDDFFKNKMESKLSYFYNEVMLKELVDSRKARHMHLRTYNAQTETFN